MALRDSLEIIKDMRIPIHEIRLIGGGAKSDLWKQMLANIFNMPIGEINTNRGGALGAAVLAAVGAGVYPDVKTGCKNMVSVVSKVKPNDDNAKKYNTVFNRYIDLYAHSKDWFNT